MTIEDVIKRIDSIPVTEIYTDAEGNYIGKALTRWVDVKPIVLEILKEMEKEVVNENTDNNVDNLLDG